MIFVIGRMSVSRQDLRGKVRMTSMEQVALDETKTAFRTSSVLAGVNCEKDGGMESGSM